MPPPPEPPRETVTEIVAESNRQRMALDEASVRSLEKLLAATMSEVRQSIMRTPRGLVGERYRRELLAGLEIALDTFRDDYKGLLDTGMLASAKLAEVRERAVLDEVLKTRKNLTFEQFTATFTQQGKTISEVSIQFGQVPVKALEKLYERTYKDGLKLSQRLYNLDQATRFEMRDIVARGLATGQSARKMAAEFAPILEKTGVDNVRYKAMRIARTEINAAYREGHVASATDEQGKLQPWIAAIGWRLSASHPRPCVCFRAGARVETISGPKPIEKIQEGDMVRTHTGQYQPVTHLYRNTFSGSLLRLCFRAGRNRTHELIVTPNHPVLTDEGWLRADALKMGCRARSLPLALSGPYGRLSSGRIDTELRGSAESWISQLRQTVGEGLCDALFLQAFGTVCRRLQEWRYPTYRAEIESGSDKGFDRRRSSDFQNPFARQTILGAQQMSKEDEGMVRASALRWPHESKTESSILQTLRYCCSRIFSRNAGTSAEASREQPYSKTESSTSCSVHIFWLQMASGMSDKFEFRASSSRMRRTDDCRTDDSLNVCRSHTLKPSGQVQRGNTRNALRVAPDYLQQRCLPDKSRHCSRTERFFASTQKVLGRIHRCSSYINYILKHVKPPAVELVNIERIPTEGETVYNLEVAKDHTYFAEGISVHNCDLYASDDSDGLGEGNYLPENVPPGHPNCLCYLVSILASMPEEQFVSMAPRPEEVPASQRKYYGFDVEE
jgi:hypothetical protein